MSEPPSLQDASEPLGAVPHLIAYEGPHDDPDAPAGGWTAAVAVILRPAEASPEVLLIERAEAQRDPWSGHMALPGGRRDPEDRSLLDTAIRETREETAIELKACGKPLGRLEVVEPESVQLPALAILPLVFAVPSTTSVRGSSSEVVGAFWTPLSHLRNPQTQTVYRHRVGGGLVRFPAFAVEDRFVWGLTRRILNDLLDRIT